MGTTYQNNNADATPKNVKDVIKQLFADFHIHTIKSIDGVLKEMKIIKSAIENDLAWISFLDHNTLQAPVELWTERGEDLKKPYITVDGLNILSGVEATCRVMSINNTKGNSTKVHLGVYGADMSPESPLSRLIALKHKNDLDYDLRRLNYLLSKTKHNISLDEIWDWMKKNYVEGELSNDQIMKFLDDKRIDLGIRSKAHLSRMLEGMPPIERFNIDAAMLIKVAHASGGKVILCHPSQNLKRTSNKMDLLETLIRGGLDGFELLYNGANRDTAKLIAEAIKKYGKGKEFIYSGGSDTHNFAEGNTLGKWNKKNNIPVESQELGLIKAAHTMMDEYLAGKRDRITVDKEVERYLARCEAQVMSIGGDAVKASSKEDLSKKSAHKGAKGKGSRRNPEDYMDEYEMY